jgi:hypothetical protein
MHHHDHDDADALGVVHPIDAPVGACRESGGKDFCAVYCYDCPVSGASWASLTGSVAFPFIHTNDMPVFAVHLRFPRRRQMF